MGSAFEIFLREIRDIPLLTPEDEKELFEKIRGADEAASRAATETVIEGNIRLVIDIAKGFGHCGLDIEDLVQEGCASLPGAIRRFDPGRGVRFATYAYSTIAGSMRRAIQTQGRTIRLSMQTSDDRLALSRAQEALRQTLGREPAPAEVADRLGWEEGKVLWVMGLPAADTSLEAETCEGGALEDIVPDERGVDPEARAGYYAVAAVLDTVLPLLTDEERRVLEMRYGLYDGKQRTYDEVAQRLGLSRECTRQTEMRAIAKIRNPRRLTAKSRAVA